MSTNTILEQARSILSQYQHPLLISDWSKDPNIIILQQGNIVIALPFSSHTLRLDLEQWLIEQSVSQALGCDVSVVQKIKSLKSHNPKKINGVKNIIAITSAKGGVGKSTTAANCALALANSGAKVGILDADVYGPSLPLMFGTRGRELEVRDGKWMQPITAHGIATHSIGYVVSQDDAAIWRGPMASKALGQLLNETEWPDLDYLVIDMPPGTGDIQITLSQEIPVTGAVVVTTPQDMALADAQKGIAMFNQVGVPVVGIVENMSYHICSHCGKHDDIFGTGGAAKVAERHSIPLLGQMPLHRQLREDIDSGTPTMIARPESEFAGYYVAMSEQISSRMYWSGSVDTELIMTMAV
ncbi:iron-sulfur cluster carrier protein ApbC [Vibrio sp. WJH972]